MNVVSKIFGIVAIVFMLLGFIPLLGWINWGVLLLAGLGLIFGAISDKQDGLKLNAIVIIIALIRLFWGGGII